MILVAGSSGVIGSYLIENLKTSRYEYSEVDFNPEGMTSGYNVDLTNPGDVEAFVKKIKKPEVLIFLVALAHEKGKKKQLEHFENINFNTLKNLMDSLKKESKLPGKLVFTSTISVYGEKYSKSVYQEDDELNPKSPYAITKKSAEEYLTENYPDISIILRFAPVYSDKFRLNIDRRTRIRNYYYKVGTGNQKLSLLNIKNIWYVINEILSEKIPAGVYNVADPESYTYNEILSKTGTGKVFTIPKVFLYPLLILTIITDNYRIKENLIKLMTDNIYSTEKLKKIIKLPYKIDN